METRRKPSAPTFWGMHTPSLDTSLASSDCTGANNGDRGDDKVFNAYA